MCKPLQALSWGRLETSCHKYFLDSWQTGAVGQLAGELFKDLTYISEPPKVTWGEPHSFTYRHVLQTASHQAVIDVSYHPLGQACMLFPPLSYVGERLGESVAADGGGVDQHRPPRELRLLQNLQDLQPVVEPPSRPQEVQGVALDQEDVHSAVQIKVPVLGHRGRPGAEPGEEKEKRTGSGCRIWLVWGGGRCVWRWIWEQRWGGRICGGGSGVAVGQSWKWDGAKCSWGLRVFGST